MKIFKIISEILSPSKWEKAHKEVGYNSSYYVQTDNFKGMAEFNKNTKFYTRDKVSLLEHLEAEIRYKKSNIKSAKMRLEEVQEIAKKHIELCGVIEMDIDTLQDEINEITLFINKLN